VAHQPVWKAEHLLLRPEPEPPPEEEPNRRRLALTLRQQVPQVQALHPEREQAPQPGLLRQAQVLNRPTCCMHSVINRQTTP
jgi:hypothetical protein